jgi:hypothetical protein
MKKLILTAVAMAATASVFAQGTVTFNNRVVGTVVTHVYAPNSANSAMSQLGNGSSDTTSGSTSWAGFPLIGAGGTAGQYGGATTFAQLIAAPGTGAAEASLVPASPATTFRTGAAGGFIASATVTMANVAPDATAASIEMVAWDNSTGNYPTWTQAKSAWLAGTIAAGESGILNIANIGGTLNTPPNLVGLQSFNLYVVPEPSTFALAGLGAAALLIFRRRK